MDNFKQPDSIEVSEGVKANKIPLKYMAGPTYYLISDWVKLFTALWNIKAEIHLIKLPNHIDVTAAEEYKRKQDNGTPLDYLRERELYYKSMSGLDNTYHIDGSRAIESLVELTNSIQSVI